MSYQEFVFHSSVKTNFTFKSNECKEKIKTPIS